MRIEDSSARTAEAGKWNGVEDMAAALVLAFSASRGWGGGSEAGETANASAWRKGGHGRMGWWSGVRDSSSVEEERDSGGVAAVDVGVGAAQPQHVRLVAELANCKSASIPSLPWQIN